MTSADRAATSAGLAASAPAATCDLGVLFVHGIGDQHEGETLLAFGEPILEYLRRTVTRLDPERLDFVAVSDAMLLPSRRLDPRTAWAALDLHVPQQGPPAPDGAAPSRKQRWLLTEAWWGEQVIAPAPLTLIGWLMTRGPWIFLTHIVERCRGRLRLTIEQLPSAVVRRVPAALRGLFELTKSGVTPAGFAWSVVLALAGLVLVWAPLVLVVQTVLLALAVLVLVPLPRIGRFVSTFLLRATGVIGDSYVLVQHEAQRAAIVARVRLALAQLKEQCARVAIVAHSQGTAIVYDALRGKAAKPDALVTFGSGLAKLEMLRISERLSRSSLTATGWVVPLALAAALLWLRHRGDPDIAEGRPAWVLALKSLLTGNPESRISLALIAAFALAATSLICLAFGLVALRKARKVLEAQRRGERDADWRLAGRWVDLCATHDPVPHASLRASLGRDEIDVRTVTNRLSFTSDHTSYFDNRAEFVPQVAQVLCDTAGLRIADGEHDKLLKDALRHHVASVHLLWWTRLVCGLALPVIAFLFWPRLRKDGGEWLAVIEKLPGKPIDVDGWVGSASTWAQTLSGNGVERQDCAVVALLVVGALATWLWRHAFGPMWRWWDRVVIDDALDGTVRMGPWTRRLVALPVALAGVLPVLLVALWLFGLEIEQAVSVALGTTVAAAFFGLFVLAIVGPLLALVFNAGEAAAESRALLDRATDPREPWRSFLLALLAIGAVPAMVVSLVGRITPYLVPKSEEARRQLPIVFAAAALLLAVRAMRSLRLRGYTAATSVALSFAPPIAATALGWWLPLGLSAGWRALAATALALATCWAVYAASRRPSGIAT